MLAEVLESRFSTKYDMVAVNNNLSQETALLRAETREEFGKVYEKMDFFRAETQAELVSVRHDMAIGFAGVATEFAKVRTEISETRSETIKWMFYISTAQAALIISVLKFFH